MDLAQAEEVAESGGVVAHSRVVQQIHTQAPMLGRIVTVRSVDSDALAAAIG